MRTRPARIVTAVTTIALLAGACADDGSPSARVGEADDPTANTTTGTSPGPTTGTSRRTTPSSTLPGGSTTVPGGASGRFVRALAPFADCATFLDHIKAEARERVGPWGLDPGGWWWIEEAVMVDEMAEDAAEEPAAEPTSNAPAGTDSGSGDVTDTNVQEAGVDEPDIVKSDGDRILAVTENRLYHIDISAGAPRVTDRLDLPEGWGHELFFEGDRAVLFTNGGSFGVPEPAVVGQDIAMPFHSAPAALVIEVDLSNPDDLREVSTLRIEGSYLSARRVGDTVRMAITTGPQQLPWVYPQHQGGEDRAAEANRQVVEESTLADWTPGYELTINGGTSTGDLLGCERLNRPASFSGFDVISVLDIDLARGVAAGFDPAAAVGVLAGGSTIYSSLDRFYVATTEWVGVDDIANGTVVDGWHEDYETELHAFEFVPGAPARYVASGAVAGSLLNQFSLDEHDGFLRVVTTDGSPWNQDQLSSTGLTVLREEGDQLVQVGFVGGLGEGETLYSARLLDDVGFAVTFRQIDPFYVLDLRDPAAPRVTGELKIPGFSTYLHPLGDGRVLGVGQDATEEGQTTGLKVSMFDVTDPAAPREIAVWTLPNASSDAEYDHRAFQILGSTVILPVTEWNSDWVGAVLLDVSGGITEIGRVTHLAPEAQPTSDCRQITSQDGLPESSELWWMVEDGYGHVQLCEADDAGGWGTFWCDQIPVDDVGGWSADPQALESALAALGAEAGDRIEMCWPDGNWQQQIRRSLVADGVLYTVSAGAVQANRLDDLAIIAQVPLD